MQTIHFGTDGVRETAGKWPMDIQGAQRMGMGIGRYLRENDNHPRVLIGRDTRISGDMLASAISAGLLSYGVNVVDAGVITTAGVATLTRKHGFNLGVVISASHNPWTENGVKLVGPDGFKFKDELEAKVEGYINEALPSEIQDFGTLSVDTSLVEDYVQYLIAPFDRALFSRLCLVMDCSNGAASAIAPRCFELLGTTVHVVNNQPDGKNINNNAGSEVVRAGRSKLPQLIREQGAHFGAAFDGDADRAVFIDESGALVDGDHVLYMLGKHLHEKGELSGSMIVTTEMANAGLEKALTPDGIQVKYTKVGDKYVVREMRENGYKVGGEQSGHIIVLDDDHTTGDGIYTALYVAQVLLEKPQISLRAAAEGMAKFPQVIASAKVSAKPKLDDLGPFVQARDAVNEELEGKAVINTRYSGTEPLFRVMIQSETGHTMEDIARLAIRLCRAVQSATGDANAHIDVKDCTTGASIDVTGEGE